MLPYISICLNALRRLTRENNWYFSILSICDNRLSNIESKNHFELNWYLSHERHAKFNNALLISMLHWTCRGTRTLLIFYLEIPQTILLKTAVCYFISKINIQLNFNSAVRIIGVAVKLPMAKRSSVSHLTSDGNYKRMGKMEIVVDESRRPHQLIKDRLLSSVRSFSLKRVENSPDTEDAKKCFTYNGSTERFSCLRPWL